MDQRFLILQRRSSLPKNQVEEARKRRAGNLASMSPLNLKGGGQRGESDNAPDLREFEKEEEQKETYKFEHLAKNLTKPLYKLSTFFPLDLVPDDVIIDLHKITIVHKDLFGVKNINTISSEDLEDAVMESSWLYATLRLQPRGKEEVVVRFLEHKEAEEAQRILDGIVQSNKAGIDLTKLHPDHVKEKLLRLGKSIP